MRALANIESGKAHPKKETIDAIRKALVAGGVKFISGGVRLKNSDSTPAAIAILQLPKATKASRTAASGREET